MEYTQIPRKRKKGKKEKVSSGISYRLSLPQDYPWRVITSLKTDLEHLLPNNVSLDLGRILRNRDIAALFGFIDEWNLQSIGMKLVGYSTDEISAVYQLSSLLKRYRFDTEEHIRVESARKKFFDAEAQCAAFNKQAASLTKLSAPWDLAVFTYARCFCATLLGEIPDWFKISEWSRHGPGSTLSTQNGENSVYHKYAQWPYDCTQAAQVYARALISDDERWLGALQDDYRRVMEIPVHMPLNMEMFWVNVISIVKGNRITTVPKDARTERTIAIEPTLNLMLQLGVDGFVRKRLKRFGVDLDDQTINQKLSQDASIDRFGDTYATIDLKSASDTISTGLLKLLLPPYWFDYLMHIRSPKGDFQGVEINYQKISSMGNGYTFAIESAIFTAIIKAVGRMLRGDYDFKFAVYGDDLIVPDWLARGLVCYLQRFGFTTNTDKTFFKGPIRESCGTDWFKGQNIRPVFISETPSSIKMLLSDRNRLMRRLYRLGVFHSNVVSLFDGWIPARFKNFVGPLSEEEFDTYIHSPYPVTRYRDGIWRFKRLVSTPIPQRGPSFFFRKLMATLRGQDLSSPSVWWKTTIPEGGSGGSLFTVSRRNRQRVSVSPASTSIWLEDYTWIDIRSKQPRV